MEKNTHQFVSGLNLLVIQSTTIFLDRYPVMKTILNKNEHGVNNWDFYMTVAGVGNYILKNKVDDKTKKELVHELSLLDKQMVEGLDNLYDFMKNNKNEHEGSVGVWVLWNIMGEMPTHEESEELAPAISKYFDFITIRTL